MKEISEHDPAPGRRRACDIGACLCRAGNIGDDKAPPPSPPAPPWPADLLTLKLPPGATRPVNRCNLPAEALASLAYSLAPQALELDLVGTLHHRLFAQLAALAAPEARAALFQAHMRAHFLLDDAGAAGFSEGARSDRRKLDYLRLLRGWMFDAEGREAAVLKGWVESRFGLMTRFHRQRLPFVAEPSAAGSGHPRRAFEQELAETLYCTGAIEAQIDLLYAFAQSELPRRMPGTRHLRLYRGIRSARSLDILAHAPDGQALVLLNNLSSFSTDPERADEFGDRVMACDIPLTKVLAFSNLLPGRLKGEDEYLVIGGVHAIEWVR